MREPPFAERAADAIKDALGPVAWTGLRWHGVRGGARFTLTAPTALEDHDVERLDQEARAAGMRLGSVYFHNAGADRKRISITIYKD